MKSHHRLSQTSCVCILISVVTPLFAQTGNPVPKHDVQLWNDTQLAVTLSRKVDFTLQGTIRMRANFKQAVDERWGVGWVIKPNKYLSLNPFYFHREARPPNGTSETEERLTLGAILRVPLGKFALVERNYFERRWRDPQVDAWRYRLRNQLEHPFKLGKAAFVGYVADELFYDWSVHDWVRNRATVGATHAFNKHLTLDLYLMRQNDGLTRPGDVTVLGSHVKLRL